MATLAQLSNPSGGFMAENDRFSPGQNYKYGTGLGSNPFDNNRRYFMPQNNPMSQGQMNKYGAAGGAQSGPWMRPGFQQQFAQRFPNFDPSQLNSRLQQRYGQYLPQQPAPMPTLTGGTDPMRPQQLAGTGGVRSPYGPYGPPGFIGGGAPSPTPYSHANPPPNDAAERAAAAAAWTAKYGNQPTSDEQLAALFAKINQTQRIGTPVVNGAPDAPPLITSGGLWGPR